MAILQLQQISELKYSALYFHAIGPAGAMKHWGLEDILGTLCFIRTQLWYRTGVDLLCLTPFPNRLGALVILIYILYLFQNSLCIHVLSTFHMDFCIAQAPATSITPLTPAVTSTLPPPSEAEGKTKQANNNNNNNNKTGTLHNVFLNQACTYVIS